MVGRAHITSLRHLDLVASQRMGEDGSLAVHRWDAYEKWTAAAAEDGVREAAEGKEGQLNEYIRFPLCA